MDQHLFNRHQVYTNRLIYTPSTFAKSSLLHLQEVGTLTAAQPHESHRENLSSFLFFIVTDGSGAITYGDRDYELKKGDCVFIDCRTPYSHRTNKDLWTLKWAHFYGPTMNSIYEKYKERGGLPVFSPKNSSAFATLLDELYVTASSPSYIRDMKICEHLTALLTHLMEESWNPDSNTKAKKRSQNLQYMKDYIDGYFFEKLSLERMAEIFFFNKYYLSRAFKDQFGVTVNGYINQVRITHAKNRLRYSDDSMNEIAEQCGFDNANYFSRAFKKEEGMSPTQYRKLW